MTVCPLSAGTTLLIHIHIILFSISTCTAVAFLLTFRTLYDPFLCGYPFLLEKCWINLRDRLFDTCEASGIYSFFTIVLIVILYIIKYF